MPAPENVGTVFCSSCGRPSRNAAKFCAGCGVAIELAQVDPTPVAFNRAKGRHEPFTRQEVLRSRNAASRHAVVDLAQSIGTEQEWPNGAAVQDTPPPEIFGQSQRLPTSCHAELVRPVQLLPGRIP